VSGHGTESEGELREIIAQTYGMISHVDENIGRVLSALEERGLAGETVVVLMADHGEYLGAHGLLHKGPWPWEELWRVPFVWRLPDTEGTDAAARTPVSLLDFAPTISELAELDSDWHDQRGAARGGGAGLPGESLLPLLNGEETRHQPSLIEYDEDWSTGSPICRQRGIVEDNWKLVIWAGTDEGLLIDLESDRMEQCNLWDDPTARDRKTALLGRLAERLAHTDRFDTPRICGA
jgi:arylsulfatase A-like enzyme